MMLKHNKMRMSEEDKSAFSLLLFLGRKEAGKKLKKTFQKEENETKPPLVLNKNAYNTVEKLRKYFKRV